MICDLQGLRIRELRVDDRGKICSTYVLRGICADKRWSRLCATHFTLQAMEGSQMAVAT
jgi:hypothetical protein